MGLRIAKKEDIKEYYRTRFWPNSEDILNKLYNNTKNPNTENLKKDAQAYSLIRRAITLTTAALIIYGISQIGGCNNETTERRYDPTIKSTQLQNNNNSINRSYITIDNKI